MSASSTLDPDATAGSGAVRPPGHDTGALGPSDVSDTGSDSVGPTGYERAILGSDSDSAGTGVDLSPAGRNGEEPGRDIGFDRIVGADEAGLGGGLDQAEEARCGVTDESLGPVDESGAAPDPDGSGPSPSEPGRRARHADVERGQVSAGDGPDEPGDDAAGVELPGADPDDAVDEDDEDGATDDADDPDAR